MFYFLLALLFSFSCVLSAPLEKNEDEQRAGIGDLVNPIKPLLGENNGNKEQGTNNGLLPNPLGGNTNFLNDAKIFLLTAQGMVMPAGAVADGFTNFFQNIGSNMGNLFQGIPNLIPGQQ